MALDLPAPVATYFAAKNQHDIDGMLATFAENATVRDEGKEHRGRVAIRAWMEHTTAKYKVSSTPEDFSAVDGELIVRALVAGNFPGSPARLTYRFKLDNAGISALSIG